MSQDRRLLDHQLDRLERVLERCIKADKAATKERRAQIGELRMRMDENSKRILSDGKSRVKSWKNCASDSGSETCSPKH